MTKRRKGIIAAVMVGVLLLTLYSVNCPGPVRSAMALAHRNQMVEKYEAYLIEARKAPSDNYWGERGLVLTDPDDIQTMIDYIKMLEPFYQITLGIPAGLFKINIYMGENTASVIIGLNTRGYGFCLGEEDRIFYQLPEETDKEFTAFYKGLGV